MNQSLLEILHSLVCPREEWRVKGEVTAVSCWQLCFIMKLLLFVSWVRASFAKQLILTKWHYSNIFLILEKIKIWLPLGMGKQARGRLLGGTFANSQTKVHRVFTVCTDPQNCFPCDNHHCYQLSYTTVVMARTSSNMCARLWPKHRSGNSSDPLSIPILSPSYRWER